MTYTLCRREIRFSQCDSLPSCSCYAREVGQTSGPRRRRRKWGFLMKNDLFLPFCVVVLVSGNRNQWLGKCPKAPCDCGEKIPRCPIDCHRKKVYPCDKSHGRRYDESFRGGDVEHASVRPWDAWKVHRVGRSSLACSSVDLRSEFSVVGALFNGPAYRCFIGSRDACAACENARARAVVQCMDK